MFALVFSAGGKKYGIALENVSTVSPAFDIVPDASRPAPFAGWHRVGGVSLPAFDLNYALTSKPATRLFGTRHIIADVDFGGRPLRIALIVEKVSNVAEFPSLEKPVYDAETVSSDGEKIELVDVAGLLKGSLFAYGD